MNELVERLGSALSSAAGGMTSAGVTALMTLAGMAYGDPSLIVAGTVAAPVVGGLTEQGAEAVRQIWFDRRSKVARFATTASAESGRSVEDLLTEMNDPGKRELLARCVEAASRSMDEWKIDVLARVFVATAEDGAKVDQGVLLVDALRQIEGLHVRLLRILAMPGPKKMAAPGTPDGPLGLGALGTGGPDVWPVEEILAVDPDLRGAFDYLVGRLSQLGMVYDEAPSGYGGGRGDWQLTEFGRGCAAYLERQANDAP